MPSVNYTVKLDEANKKQAEFVLKELGLSLSVAINVYINAIARNGEIPFKLSLHNNAKLNENFEDYLICKNFIEKMQTAEAQSRNENSRRYSFEEVLENFDSKVNENG